MYRFCRSTAQLRSAVLVSPLIGALVAPLSLQATAVGVQEAVAFIEVLGSDTTAVEVFVRTTQVWEGQLLLRAPVTRVATYRADLRLDGSIERFEVTWETPSTNPLGPAPRRITFDFRGDSAVIETDDSTGHKVKRFSVPKGTIPTLDKVPWSVALFQQAIEQARRTGGDSVPVWFLGSRTRGAYENAIVRRAADTVALDFFGSPYVARITDIGYILVVSGEQTTVKYVSRRADGVDIESLAARFGQRDADGRGLGVMSPRDEVIASVGGAALTVDYGRPSKRGREIFGELVQWNTVWRTGANAATHLSTDRDLQFGDVTLPAGTYTLWTTFTPTSAYLIINSQTEIWGTQYDSTYDFARIRLEREALDTPVERFTITVTEVDDGGLLSFAWDEAGYWATFDVKQ